MILTIKCEHREPRVINRRCGKKCPQNGTWFCSLEKGHGDYHEAYKHNDTVNYEPKYVWVS